MQTQHNSKDLRSHEETGCKDSNEFQSDTSHGRVHQSKMNEQVRTLNQGSSSSPLFQTPELPSTLLLLTSFWAQLRKHFSQLSLATSNLLQRGNLGRLGGEDAAHYGR